jgi:hypothetical protein
MSAPTSSSDEFSRDVPAESGPVELAPAGSVAELVDGPWLEELLPGSTPAGCG